MTGVLLLPLRLGCVLVLGLNKEYYHMISPFIKPFLKLQKRHTSQRLGDIKHRTRFINTVCGAKVYFHVNL